MPNLCAPCPYRCSATLRQISLVTKLQAVARGYQVRSYARYVERAMEIR